MKKLLAILFIIFAIGLPCVSPNVFSARAIEHETKYYLINANYAQDAAKYGILTDEIKTTSTPFDIVTKQMMVGQSISPIVSNSTTQTFTKMLNTNLVEINDSQSLYLWVYFSEEVANNLLITLLDSQNNSASWQILGQTITNNIVVNIGGIPTRYGWQLLELPFSAAQKVGDLQQITQLKIEYGANSENNNSYAKVSVYAPYVSNLKSFEVKFADKQKFYNFNINYGQNLDKLCVGDSYELPNWKSLFEYCILGEIDFLKYNTNAYQFKFEIIDAEYNHLESAILGIDEVSVQFSEEGSYSFMLTLYDNQSNVLSGAPSKQIYVDKFVAIYLKNGLPNMKENTTSRFEIYIGDYVEEWNNLYVRCSDSSVAEVSLDGQHLVIKTNNSGNATITLSVNAKRTNSQEQIYTCSYNLKVAQDNTIAYTGIILGAIGLIIVSVLLYIIMVKRRLIPGKYPKY